MASLVTSVRTTVEGVGVRRLLGLPRPVVERLVGRPVVIDGRTLDPEMKLLLTALKTQPAPETLPISGGRRSMDRSAQIGGGRQPIGAVTDRTIDGPGGPIPLRFYTPRGMTGEAPALVFLHGGAWIYGGLASHDAVCRYLAERAQVRVVAVDYRLAPEAPFPAAFEDAWAAWSWVVEHADALGIDPDRIAIGGDSAGGNLAAVVSQEAVAASIEPAFQLLIYPATDFSRTYDSERRYGAGFYLTTEFMELGRDNYLVGDEDLTTPALSPLHGRLEGLPPAYLVTAGFDPLLDEGTAYAEAMIAAGVEVEHVCEDSLIHGFMNMLVLGRAAPAACARVADALRRGLQAHQGPRFTVT